MKSLIPDHTAVKPAVIAFDWGGTLMWNDPQATGPMMTWPQVAAVPGVQVALEALSKKYQLVVATNAADSDETAIRAALERVELNQYIERVYCQRSIGFYKPSADYFTHVLNDLQLEAREVLMVGDSFPTDILGASRCGLWAVWLNRRNLDEQSGDTYRTIHDLSRLPGLLQDWHPDG
ncbi:MAG: HAD family hydrolase [Anaerolineaceae bacterium]|nr:HAD family hydrolase [Anaerolineaceae bacterium]